MESKTIHNEAPKKIVKIVYIRKNSAEARAAREADMLKMLESGKTLQEIGDHYSISRQAVHSIFTRRGVSTDKGAKVRKSAKESAFASKKEKRISETWDLTVAEYEAHVAKYGSSEKTGSPMNRYIHHRKSARHRNIEWNFTFKTWWQVWLESGKWNERGAGQYSMGRNGDASAPLGPTTCKIATVSEIITGDFFNRKKGGGRKKPKAEEL